MDGEADATGYSQRKACDAVFDKLRIALEALYLKGFDDELGFRVANYGAWHLGADFDQRLPPGDQRRRGECQPHRQS